MALARSSHIVVLSERITQVHTLYPSLGVRKWSIYKSARSLVSPHEETETKQKTSKTHKANKKPTKASWQVGKYLECCSNFFFSFTPCCKPSLASAWLRVLSRSCSRALSEKANRRKLPDKALCPRDSVRQFLFFHQPSC